MKFNMNLYIAFFFLLEGELDQEVRGLTNFAYREEALHKFSEAGVHNKNEVTDRSYIFFLLNFCMEFCCHLMSLEK